MSDREIVGLVLIVIYFLVPLTTRWFSIERRNELTEAGIDASKPEGAGELAAHPCERA